MIVGSNILAGASGQQGYFLNRSLRFRASASAWLNRTPASAGNQHTWTWSCWIKRGTSGAQIIYNTAGSIGSNSALGQIYFDANNKLTFFQYNVSTTYTALATTQVFRDFSSWYHIVIAYDDPQATASNRVKIYVNGVQVTAFDTATYPTQNFNGYFNLSQPHSYARDIEASPTAYFDGYLAEINFIDGQALTPTSFGAFNVLTGIWQPIKYSGTYGTQGYYLNFNDNSAATAAAIGKDLSGNGNNWTPNNISITAGATYDSMTDVPTLTSPTTANYAVMNPTFAGTSGVLNGNLDLGLGSTMIARSSILMTTGKWYAEFTMVAAGANSCRVGITGETSTTVTNYLGSDAVSWGYTQINGVVYNNAAAPFTYATYTNGDIIGVAYDADARNLSFYKNNTLQGTITSANITAGNYYFAVQVANSTPVGWACNFGQRPFSYTPPTGFVALNTYNLPTPTIANGAIYMAASLYTGNGATQTINNSINGFSFQPDMVWIKNRSAAYTHTLYDSVRGSGQYLQSNTTDIESNGGSAFLTSFNSNGFSIGSQVTVNNSGNGLVGWQWRASNSSAVSNTSGTITSSISANTTSGFSIATYTGNGTNGATVGHGLGVAPAFGIWKVKSGTIGNWVIYHQSLGATLGLNFTTSGATSSSVFFNNTAPNSSVWTLGTVTDVNRNTSTYVLYSFSEIAGYSKFGKYTGNGAADAPFVYLGFRPKFILFKCYDQTDNWIIFDSSRDSYNVAGDLLYPNTADSEQVSPPRLDFLSNGFKLRSGANTPNGANWNYIYAAFAESPFKLALAR